MRDSHRVIVEKVVTPASFVDYLKGELWMRRVFYLLLVKPEMETIGVCNMLNGLDCIVNNNVYR